MLKRHKNTRPLFTMAAGGIAAAFVVGLAMWAAGEPTFAAGCLTGAALASLILAGILMTNDRRDTVARAESSETSLRLAEQLITAEQDERRRLSILLHDGPLQELSGVALMHDAALSALTEERRDEALDILRGALERERGTIQTMRDLSFAIEPIILRDYGFEAAVRAIADQLERSGETQVEIDVVAGELLAEKMQVALYQTVRETLGQAERRNPSSVRVGWSSAVATSHSNATCATTVTASDVGGTSRRSKSARACFKVTSQSTPPMRARP